MASRCVYDCVHPLWGGDGACSDDGSPQGATCECSPGYASKDFLGNPSCVLTKVLWTLYLVGTVLGAAMALFLAWHIAKYFNRSASTRRTRKALLRLAILSAAW